MLFNNFYLAPCLFSLLTTGDAKPLNFHGGKVNAIPIASLTSKPPSRSSSIALPSSSASSSPPASPTTLVNKSNVISIKQVANPSFKASSTSTGPSVYQAALKKNLISVPAALAQAVSNLNSLLASTGQVNANPTSYDTQYLTPITVGSNKQSLSVSIDTGSSDFWVFSSLLPSSMAGQHSVYTPTASTTAVLMPGQTWNVKYYDTSAASGIVYRDNVNLDTLSVSGQAVEVAQAVSSQFTSTTGLDGLIGLAFSSLNMVRPTQQKTVMTNLMSSLKLPVFCANLRKGAAGTFDFGYIDPTKYSGSITYLPLSSSAPGYWAITSSSYTIGSATAQTVSVTGIVDTGSTLLILPSSIVTSYYAQVAGSRYDGGWSAYVFPCTGAADSSALLPFSMQFGSYSANIPASYLNYGPINSTHCYGGMQVFPSNSGSVLNAIFGDIFIKTQFVVFDQGNSRIGLAAKSAAL